MPRKFKVGQIVDAKGLEEHYNYMPKPFLFAKVIGYYSGSRRPYDVEVTCADGVSRWAAAAAKQLSLLPSFEVEDLL